MDKCLAYYEIWFFSYVLYVSFKQFFGLKRWKSAKNHEFLEIILNSFLICIWVFFYQAARTFMVLLVPGKHYIINKTNNYRFFGQKPRIRCKLRISGKKFSFFLSNDFFIMLVANGQLYSKLSNMVFLIRFICFLLTIFWVKKVKISLSQESRSLVSHCTF